MQPVERAAQVPSFYSSAAATLVTLLIAWLVAEARILREELRTDGTATKRKTSLIVVAAGLMVGAGTALLVEFEGRAHTPEKIITWASLGLGFTGVTISIAQSVLLTSDKAWNELLLRRRRIVKRWAPIIIAVAAGIVASPLVRTKTVPTGTRYPVYGLRISGATGLIQRTGPGANYPEVASHPLLRESTLVFVICQAKGEPPPGSSNPIWDELRSGAFVSDAFIYTPNRSGGFTYGIPKCGGVG